MYVWVLYLRGVRNRNSCCEFSRQLDSALHKYNQCKKNAAGRSAAFIDELVLV